MVLRCASKGESASQAHAELHGFTVRHEPSKYEQGGDALVDYRNFGLNCLNRLESVAMSCLDKPVRWAFWHMAKSVRLRGRLDFWQCVTQIATESFRSPVAVKAYWLLLVRANQPVRRRVSSEFGRAKYEPGYSWILYVQKT